MRRAPAGNRRYWIRCSKGINLVGGAGTGPVGTTVGGVPQTGAGQLRAATASSLRNNLANGNYVALATSLYTLNYAASINPGLPVIPQGVQGAVLRYNNFAENFIEASPQFSAANLQTNLGNTNYHSFQLQSTLRPTAGVNFQATYTWSKLLGNARRIHAAVRPPRRLHTADRRYPSSVPHQRNVRHSRRPRPVHSRQEPWRYGEGH